MISFAQYIEEGKRGNIAAEWKITPITPKQAARTLVNNCSLALNALLVGKVFLCRGFGGPKNSARDGRIIDTTKSVRASRDLSNLYQLAHDESIHTLHIPSRSNSLICTTRPSVARAYDSNRAVHLVFPYDGYAIAVSPVADFIDAPVRSKLFNGDVKLLDDFLGTLISPFIRPTNGKFWDASEINKALSSMSNEEFMWYYVQMQFRWDREFVGNNVSIDMTVGKDIDDDRYFDVLFSTLDQPTKSTNILKNLGPAIDLFKSRKLKWSDDIADMMDIVRKMPKNKRFTALSAEIFGTATQHPKVIYDPMELSGNRNNECWFSGKSVVIQLSNTDADTPFIKALRSELNALDVDGDNFKI